MKITKLETQKRNPGRYNLEIDGEFSCGMDEVLIIEFDLFSGKEINDALLEKIKDEDDYQKCLNKAFNLLAIRMNSESELKKKLSKKYEHKTIGQVVSRLKELGYVDDQLFVKSWISSREAGRGQYLLKRELLQKGINKDLIDEFLAERDMGNELENARNLITKKHWPEMTREEKYQKIGGFLARRGFNYEIIKRIINED